jgi:peptidyl-prolyl cis-trans isomerase B (cyclophilin B)
MSQNTRVVAVGAFLALVICVALINTLTHHDVLETSKSNTAKRGASPIKAPAEEAVVIGDRVSSRLLDGVHVDTNVKFNSRAVGLGELKEASSARPHVTFKTCLGPITFEMRPDFAPKTVAHLLALFASPKWKQHGKLYRFESGFCLQGGLWPDASHATVGAHEYNEKLPNKKYFVSMARTNDPLSASSEFSIMLADNSKWLGPGGSEKYGYAVMAEVVGEDSIETINKFSSQAVEKKGGLTYLAKQCMITDTIVQLG